MPLTTPALLHHHLRALLHVESTKRDRLRRLPKRARPCSPAALCLFRRAANRGILFAPVVEATRGDSAPTGSDCPSSHRLLSAHSPFGQRSTALATFNLRRADPLFDHPGHSIIGVFSSVSDSIPISYRRHWYNLQLIISWACCALPVRGGVKRG
ncbi:hypothetical protein T440DRAFT_476718 [Plenodomus tracheiphilus IPT5]|uniref:Uncharacterized protein n=1 Tax=Plenodomus tracheiphilus IPT5 TaxID=1408161 RepID=A0A6A7BFJ7_9PLEO|nr:hypothetical protein T440DRAFT_476718 [Plenodomus tracheiphilus IPT5]